MNFFHTPLDKNIQVLWHPVPIQQIESKAIEELKQENQLLKSQLLTVLSVKIRRFRNSKDPIMVKHLSGQVTPLQGISTPPHHPLKPEKTANKIWSTHQDFPWTITESTVTVLLVNPFTVRLFQGITTTDNHFTPMNQELNEW